MALMEVEGVVVTLLALVAASADRPAVEVPKELMEVAEVEEAPALMLKEEEVVLVLVHLVSAALPLKVSSSRVAVVVSYR
jgi:hypothetical protein